MACPQAKKESLNALRRLANSMLDSAMDIMSTGLNDPDISEIEYRGVASATRKMLESMVDEIKEIIDDYIKEEHE